MIDRIFQTVKILVNAESRGNVSPNEFNLILHNVVQQKFEELFFDANRLINRQNRGLINGGLENTTDKVREKIEHYITPYAALTYSSPTFTLPADLRYFDTILYNTTPIEICKSNKEFEVVSTTTPTTEYPIGLKQGSTLKVLPTSIVANVTMSYLRNPAQAKWTYTVISEVEVFNPSAGDYVDVDAHPSEEEDITLRVLQQFGVNLKEIDIQKATQAEKVLEFQQENTN